MTFYKILIKTLFLLSFVWGACAYAHQNSEEQIQLTAMLRQVELMQDTIRSFDKSINPRSRYYFDYQRLNTDLERVRAGIHDYLTPKRAQPRDPVQLHGNYQQETRRLP